MPTLETSELILRIALALALGGLIGLEREVSDQPAGLRTHILVSLGAALFTITGAFGLAGFGSGGTARVSFDPTRVAAQVVTGIGFLGAGAIIQRGVNVRGLTTAASLWVTAAIGTAVGLGYLSAATITTVAALVALVLLKAVEHSLVARVKRGSMRMVIDAEETFSIAQMAAAIERAGGRLDSMRMFDDDSGGHRLVAIVKLARGRPQANVIEAVRRLAGVSNIDTGV
jgi:putative Mg2+ transporter-C (MgtC) family protein